MFTEASMKIGDRLRRLVWRSQTKTYRVWIGSTVVSMFAFKSFVVALGPSDTHEARMAANGTYANRKYAETNDNPIYRLPENEAGGHRIDGQSPWAARSKMFVHH